MGTSEGQVRKNSVNIKFLGGMHLGHPGPRRRDIPDKDFMQEAFFCCFRQGVAGISWDLGRDVPDLEKLYARKLWADFSYPSRRSRLNISSEIVSFLQAGLFFFKIRALRALSLKQEIPLRCFGTGEARGPGSLGGPGSWYSHAQTAHSSRKP